jgi:hypothetical protein
MSAFQRIFPQRGKLVFDGGLNSKFDRALIENNQSPDCLNVISDEMSIQTRQGFAKLNTAAVGSFVGDGLFTRRADTGAETMVMFAGGTGWQLGTTTFTTIASAQSIYTAGVKVFSEMQENYLFICNGYSLPYKWNGAEFTRHGIYPPTTTSTVGTSGAGVLTGSYNWKITAVNSGLVESDVGPVTASWTGASEAATLTALPTFAASFGVSARKIYRTAAGGTTFKLVTTISDNTTTTYTDNTADASLGATAPTDQGVPPKWSAIKYHQGRLFMLDPANPNYLWYTELNNPYVVQSTNFIKIGDKTSDLMRGLGVWQNNLAVFGDRYVHLIFMPDTDPSNWQVTKTQSPYGCNSPKCILEINSQLLFPAIKNDNLVGYSLLDGISIAQNATFLTNNAVGSDLISDPIEPEVDEQVKTAIPNIAGIVYGTKAWISFQSGTGSTENNRVLQLDFTRSNLGKPQGLVWYPFNGFKASDWTVYGGDLYFSSAIANGFVYKAEAGVYSDDGAAINSYFWTKEFECIPGEENYTKDFRFAKMLIGKVGDWYMNLRYKTDSDKGSGDSQQINLDAGGSNWGTMIWGVDTWGGGSDEENLKVFLRGKRGDRIQFRFDNQNTAGQWFKVLNMSLAYNRKGQR